MEGTGWIVICMSNPNPSALGFREHTSLAEAMEEAERLTMKTGKEFVVYEPISRCKPAPRVLWSEVEKQDIRIGITFSTPTWPF